MRSQTLRLLMNHEFTQELTRALASAQRRVLVQVMTFDGDASGLGMADLLARAAGRGVDVRLLVDCYALRYVSDRRATRAEVRDEAAETALMFERLRAAGVAVTFTHPWGPISVFGPCRNHKKIFVVDDHAYLGGVNISDHNFAWRDFMVRLDDPAATETLAEDFARTERGDRRSVNAAIAGGATVITNAEIEPAFHEIVRGALHSLVLASPYSLDVGIVRLLEASPARRKTVITARRNNFWMLRAGEPYLWRRLMGDGTDLRTYPDFFHARFLLADDAKLLIGSSHFSRHSFRCNQEICLLITDPGFISAFTAAMLPDTEPLDPRPTLRSAVTGAVASRLFFYAITGIARLIAPRVPPLARR